VVDVSGGRRDRSEQPCGKHDKPARSDRPLLVIDGDSFAHRSYHALPKTIRRSDGKGAGAILGFANFVLRLFADERPRAVIVGWTPWGRRRNVTKCLPLIRVGESSMMI
jgi:hypothetical protein